MNCPICKPEENTCQHTGKQIADHYEASTNRPFDGDNPFWLRRKVAKLKDEQRRLKEEIHDLKSENVCDVCLGKGAPLSIRTCMCGGTGKMSDGTFFLRKELFKAEADTAMLYHGVIYYLDAHKIHCEAPIKEDDNIRDCDNCAVCRMRSTFANNRNSRDTSSQAVKELQEFRGHLEDFGGEAESEYLTVDKETAAGLINAIYALER